MENQQTTLQFGTVAIAPTVPHSITDIHFFELGKAIFTVANPSNEHYTYKIRKKIFDDKRTCWFIYLLTGPQNTNDYTYLGVYVPSIHGVRLTAKSKYTEDSKPVKVLKWALTRVANNNLPVGYKIQHEGRCGRCGRTLTTPESISRGIGPECIKFY